MTVRIAPNEFEQFREKIKERWTRFTQDDLEEIADRRDELVERVQERYGQARERAEAEVDQFLETYHEKKQAAAQTLVEKRDEAKQAIDRNLTEYDRRLEQSARKLPGDVNWAVENYTWVSMLTALGVGFILGFLLKPCWGRRSSQPER